MESSGAQNNTSPTITFEVQNLKKIYTLSAKTSIKRVCRALGYHFEDVVAVSCVAFKIADKDVTEQYVESAIPYIQHGIYSSLDFVTVVTPHSHYFVQRSRLPRGHMLVHQVVGSYAQLYAIDSMVRDDLCSFDTDFYPRLKEKFQSVGTNAAATVNILRSGEYIVREKNPSGITDTIVPALRELIVKRKPQYTKRVIVAKSTHMETCAEVTYTRGIVEIRVPASGIIYLVPTKAQPHRIFARLSAHVPCEKLHYNCITLGAVEHDALLNILQKKMTTLIQ